MTTSVQTLILVYGCVINNTVKFSPNHRGVTASIIGLNIMHVMSNYSSAYLCALPVTATGFLFFGALKQIDKKQ